MPNFRENRFLLTNAYADGLIDDEEYVLLYDINKSKNLDLPYWEYDRFDLDKLCDDECKAEFRFKKNEIYNLYEVLRFPNKIRCSNGFMSLRFVYF